MGACEAPVETSPKSACEQIGIASPVEAPSPLGTGGASVQPSSPPEGTLDNVVKDMSNAASPRSISASPQIASERALESSWAPQALVPLEAAEAADKAADQPIALPPDAPSRRTKQSGCC